MAIPEGTRIGPYKVLEPLGAGGMGEVYLATDTRLGRRVALKLLSADLTKNQQRVLRFQQEARAASALNHPNILTIYEVGEIDSIHFIATEYVDSGTLRVQMQRRMTAREVLDIGVQVASALAAAHHAGIMHRDIKPENIMLRSDGYVKVVDFGLAKLTERVVQRNSTEVDPEADTHIAGGSMRRLVDTEPGTVMGTVSYMSPEQARGIQVDERTDIFSLGVVLYEAISGRVPFEGATISDVIVSILEKRPQPLARFSIEVSAELERIVSKALEKNRDERYQTVKDLLIDLKKLKKRTEIEAELDHSSPSDYSRDVSFSDSAGRKTVVSTDAVSGFRDATTIRTTSSAEYLITELKRHKKGVLVALCVLLVAGIAASSLLFRKKPVDSIAILPLTNLSDDPSMDAISDEITEGLINHLYQLPKLRVISFGSVQRYKGKQVDPQTAGVELGVRAVMIGRITKREDGITISTELVDALDKTRIWGEQSKWKFSDLELVHHRLARSIVDKLGLKFSEEERKESDSEELYAEGRNAWNQRTAEGIKQGLEYFEKAVAMKPDYALPHAGLADCYNMLASYGAKSPAEAFPKAKVEAQKALEIDNTLAEAHAALAYALFRGDWNWVAAEQEFQRAISLNPEYASAHQWYANLLIALGRPDEAVAQTKRAQQLDPSSLIISSHFGFVYYFAHHYELAVEASKKTLELDPTFFVARRYLGLAYSQRGKHGEAIEEFQKAVAASGGSPIIRAEMANAYAIAGRTEDAQRVLAELQGLTAQRYISPYHIALIYAGLGKKDETFNWLEKAFEGRADYLVYLKVDPRFETLQSDPRFASLVGRIGLR